MSKFVIITGTPLSAGKLVHSGLDRDEAERLFRSLPRKGWGKLSSEDEAGRRTIINRYGDD